MRVYLYCKKTLSAGTVVVRRCHKRLSVIKLSVAYKLKVHTRFVVLLFNMSIQDIIDSGEVEEILVSHLKQIKVFQEGPQLWTIRNSPLGGRGMFSTREIKQNELIFIDAPLIIGPKSVGKHLQMCVCCYKNECPLFPCDKGCGLPVCSVQCENSSQHINYECEYLRSLVPKCGTDWSLDLLVAMVPIRAIFMTKHQRKCLATLQYDKTFSDSHEVELLKKNVVNLPNETDMELMNRVCGAFKTNSFETVSVHDNDHSISLRGLYPMGSFQNHCCVPNTRHHFDGEYQLHVTAALPISAGEEITMSYTNLLWDTMLRRHFLNITKHFLCVCKRCSDPTEFGVRLGALLCAASECSGELLPRDSLNMMSPWQCDKCMTIINHRQIYSIRSGLAAIIEDALHKTPRQVYKFMKKELSVIVPCTNYLIVDVKFRIVSYYGRSEALAWEDLTDAELDIKAKYCNDILLVLDGLNCGDCTKKGLVSYELHCTNLEKMRRLKQQ